MVYGAYEWILAVPAFVSVLSMLDWLGWSARHIHHVAIFTSLAIHSRLLDGVSAYLWLRPHPLAVFLLWRLPCYWLRLILHVLVTNISGIFDMPKAVTIDRPPSQKLTGGNAV